MHDVEHKKASRHCDELLCFSTTEGASELEGLEQQTNTMSFLFKK